MGRACPEPTSRKGAAVQQSRTCPSATRFFGSAFQPLTFLLSSRPTNMHHRFKVMMLGFVQEARGKLPAAIECWLEVAEDIFSLQLHQRRSGCRRR